MIATLSSPFAMLLGLFPQVSIDEGGLNIPWSLALLLLSVFGYAIVNTVEIAIIGSSRIRMRHLAEEGNRSAQALERIRDREDRFFAAIVLLQNLFMFVASSLAGLLAVDLAGAWGLLFAIVIGTAGIALFGEVTPKVLAAQYADRVALFSARPVELLMVLMRPLVVLFAGVPNLLSRLFFAKRTTVTPTVTEAELRMLIDISAEEGAVGEEEAELMERVFRFYDRRVNEVMVPRTEVSWLEAGTSVAALYETFDATPHSRFPVYRDSFDDVVGVVNIKDVLRGVAQGRVTPETTIDALVRPAYFVPETKLIGQLFVEMQERRQHLAISVDEFGGTAGIVTLEQLIEEMVGRVADELAQPEQEFERIDETTVRVEGGMSVHEAREELGLELPEGEYETIAGYVLETLGHIPVAGETIQGDGFRITVAQLKGLRIEEVVVTRLPAPPDPQAESPR
ncbi:MAG: HlyC/CorC family transporter [Chloroflexi bacterium]|nr:HlyC/CorC family transporter [Chloroflexota bacterium]